MAHGSDNTADSAGVPWAGRTLTAQPFPGDDGSADETLLTALAGGDLWEVLERLDADGCARYVVTDVTKDGTLQGPNLDLLAEVCRRTSKPVVASGGISNLDDIAALRALVKLGLEGAIVGKALYSGAFTLEQALHVAG